VPTAGLRVQSEHCSIDATGVRTSDVLERDDCSAKLMASAETPDVLIVGGGVIGLAAAWRLAQCGLRVTLLERRELGGGASRVAAGMLAPAAEAEFGAAGKRLLQLGLESARKWPAFAAELAEASGSPSRLRAEGTLMVARDRDEAEALEREFVFRQDLGLEVARLRPSEARQLEPALAPTLRLAVSLPGEQSVDPRWLIEALAVSARRAGAVLREGVAVSGLRCASGRVDGVTLVDGSRLAAGSVVVAAGAWSAALGEVAVRPVKGQIMLLRDPAGLGLLKRVVRFEGGYLVPRADGRYALGATVEERGFDETVTAGALHGLLRHASELVPAVLELEVEEVAAGLRPGTPDNMPVVGPGAFEGLVWATGHYRNGILLTPVTAELVAAALGAAPASPPAKLCTPARPERSPSSSI
jgi:glycine oxidase